MTDSSDKVQSEMSMNYDIPNDEEVRPSGTGNSTTTEYSVPMEHGVSQQCVASTAESRGRGHDISAYRGFTRGRPSFRGKIYKRRFKQIIIIRGGNINIRL